MPTFKAPPGKNAGYDVQNGAMIARSILTRITKVRSGGNEPPRPNPGEGPGSTKIKPLNGQVSIGGGFENRNGTNLNPINPISGGPAKGIPIKAAIRRRRLV